MFISLLLHDCYFSFSNPINMTINQVIIVPTTIDTNTTAMFNIVAVAYFPIAITLAITVTIFLPFMLMF